MKFIWVIFSFYSVLAALGLESQLLIASETGDWERLKSLLVHGVSVNAFDSQVFILIN
jgi:hypothetical protein